MLPSGFCSLIHPGVVWREILPNPFGDEDGVDEAEDLERLLELESLRAFLCLFFLSESGKRRSLREKRRSTLLPLSFRGSKRFSVEAFLFSSTQSSSSSKTSGKDEFSSSFAGEVLRRSKRDLF